MTTTLAGIPIARPPQTHDAVTARWQATLEHVSQSGGLILAIEAVHPPDSSEVVILMATSDGQVSRHSYPKSSGTYLSAFQAWLSEHIEQVAAGRLVALLTSLPNWAGQPVAQIHPMAPQVVLPLRLAPEAMKQAMADVRDEILARPPMAPQEIGTDASRHHAKYGGTTWAWVSAAGKFRTYRSEHQLSTNAAETLAILCAASHFDVDVPLRIVSDSQAAVSIVTQLRERSITAEEAITRLRIPASAASMCRKVRWAARELPLRPVQASWVRGHDGHPLNEAANRLAILARRASAARCSQEVYSSMCSGVVEELNEQLSV